MIAVAKATTSVLLLTGLSLLSACSSNPPDWVMTPNSDNKERIAATECVPWSGHFSTDKMKSETLAKASLAAKISTRVNSVVMQTLSNSGDRETQQYWMNQTKQRIEATLSGVKIERSEILDIDDRKHLCTQVSVDKTQLRPTVKNALNQPGLEALQKEDKIDEILDF